MMTTLLITNIIKGMKRIVNVTLVAMLIVLGYHVGRLQEQSLHMKDYQSACVLSDVCRNMVDNIGTDAEEIYYDYVDNLDCDSTLRITREDLEGYSWRY